MQIVFIKLASLLICMSVGLICYRKKILDDNFNTTISKLLISITMPSTIITSLQTELTDERINNLFIVLISAVLIHLFAIAIGYLYCKLFKIPVLERGVIIFSSAFGNISFLGIPILSAMYGEESIFYIALINMIFSLFVFTVGYKIISIGYESHDQIKINPSSLIKNIPIMSTLLGLILFVFQIKIPSVLDESLRLIGSLTTPLAMLFIGSLLGKSNFKTVFKCKHAYFTALIKLIIIPIMVYFIFRPLIKDYTVHKIITLVFAMPAASLTAIIARETNSNSEQASKYIFISTILSMITIPVLYIAIPF